MISVLLFSPGIDSLLAVHELEKQGIKPTVLVHYALNTRCTKAEVDYLQQLMIPLRIETCLNLQDIEDDHAYVPNRNLIMAMHAAGKYNADTVYIGGTKSDRVSDNNIEVMKMLSDTISLSMQKPVQVTSPFWNKYKIGIAKEFVRDKEFGGKLLQGTFSCYSPHERKSDGVLVECQRCPACFRKSVILYGAADIKRAFKTPHIVDKYKQEFNGLSEEQQTPRSIVTLEYIKWLETRSQ